MFNFKYDFILKCSAEGLINQTRISIGPDNDFMPNDWPAMI